MAIEMPRARLNDYACKITDWKSRTLQAPPTPTPAVCAERAAFADPTSSDGRRARRCGRCRLGGVGLLLTSHGLL
jgi:hypothetical protein